MKLREQRAQQTATFVGIVYGITAASVFSAFIGLEIATLLTDIASGFDSNSQLSSLLFSPDLYDVGLIEYLLLCVVVINALLSSMMIRITDRGHSVNAYVHFVALTWIGAVVAVVTRHVVGGLVTV
jgi:flagellar protein FlaJ